MGEAATGKYHEQAFQSPLTPPHVQKRLIILCQSTKQSPELKLRRLPIFSVQHGLFQAQLRLRISIHLRIQHLDIEHISQRKL